MVMGRVLSKPMLRMDIQVNILESNFVWPI